MDSKYLIFVSLDAGVDDKEVEESKRKLDWVFERYDNLPLAWDATQRMQVLTIQLTHDFKPGELKAGEYLSEYPAKPEVFKRASEFTEGSDDVVMIVRCHYTTHFGRGALFKGDVLGKLINKFVDAGVLIRKLIISSCYLGAFNNEDLKLINATLRLPERNDNRPSGVSTFAYDVHFKKGGFKAFFDGILKKDLNEKQLEKIKVFYAWDRNVQRFLQVDQFENTDNRSHRVIGDNETFVKQKLCERAQLDGRDQSIPDNPEHIEIVSSEQQMKKSVKKKKRKGIAQEAEGLSIKIEYRGRENIYGWNSEANPNDLDFWTSVFRIKAAQLKDIYISDVEPGDVLNVSAGPNGWSARPDKETAQKKKQALQSAGVQFDNESNQPIPVNLRQPLANVRDQLVSLQNRLAANALPALDIQQRTQSTSPLGTFRETIGKDLCLANVLLAGNAHPRTATQLLSRLNKAFPRYKAETQKFESLEAITAFLMDIGKPIQTAEKHVERARQLSSHSPERLERAEALQKQSSELLSDGLALRKQLSESPAYALPANSNVALNGMQEKLANLKSSLDSQEKDLIKAEEAERGQEWNERYEAMKKILDGAETSLWGEDNRIKKLKLLSEKEDERYLSNKTAITEARKQTKQLLRESAEKSALSITRIDEIQREAEELQTAQKDRESAVEDLETWETKLREQAREALKKQLSEMQDAATVRQDRLEAVKKVSIGKPAPLEMLAKDLDKLQTSLKEMLSTLDQKDLKSAQVITIRDKGIAKCQTQQDNLEDNLKKLETKATHERQKQLKASLTKIQKKLLELKNRLSPDALLTIGPPQGKHPDTDLSKLREEIEANYQETTVQLKTLHGKHPDYGESEALHAGQTAALSDLNQRVQQVEQSRGINNWFKGQSPTQTPEIPDEGVWAVPFYRHHGVNIFELKPSSDSKQGSLSIIVLTDDELQSKANMRSGQIDELDKFVNKNRSKGHDSDDLSKFRLEKKRDQQHQLPTGRPRNNSNSNSRIS